VLDRQLRVWEYIDLSDCKGDELITRRTRFAGGVPGRRFLIHGSFLAIWEKLVLFNFRSDSEDGVGLQYTYFLSITFLFRRRLSFASMI
jgi:hypothetical protein